LIRIELSVPNTLFVYMTTIRRTTTVSESSPDNSSARAEFGPMIRRARENSDLTLRELGSRVDISYSYLSRIENERLPHRPSEDVVRRLARELGLNADVAMIRAGWVPQWLKDYIVQHPEVAERLMDAINQNPSDPLSEV